MKVRSTSAIELEWGLSRDEYTRYIPHVQRFLEKSPPTINWLRLLLVGSIITPMAMLVSYATHTHTLAVQELDRDNLITVRLLERQTVQVRETDQLAIQVVSNLLAQNDRSMLHANLRDLVNHMPQIAAISVVDRSGRIIDASYTSATLAELAYAWTQNLRNSSDVTKFFADSLGTQWTIGNVRRRVTPEHEFDGIIMVVDKLEYIQKTFQDALTVGTGFVALARDDGVVLELYPSIGMRPEPIDVRHIARLTDQPQVYRSLQLGEQRGHGVMMRVPETPLLIALVADSTSSLGRWYTDVRINGVLAFLNTVLLIAAGVRVRRGYLRERAASTQLQVEMQRRQDTEAKVHNSHRMEAIGQLTAGVAHEFNNMLTVIMGNAEQVLRGADPITKTTHILNAAQSGATLVARMLTFARRQIVRSDQYDANQVLADMAPMIGAVFNSRVRVVTHCIAMPLVCQFDQQEFTLAVLNIANNANHAMGNGGVFEISTAMVQDAPGLFGCHAQIILRDTGEGMPESVRERVFEPFFTTRALTFGTGLGLSHVYGFVKQAGGEVTIESNLGEGTSVVMYLPMECKPQTAQMKKLIMVVDDEHGILELIDDILTDHGYTLHCTTDSRTVVPFMAEHDVDLLLSDIVMPHLTGIDLAKQVNRQFPRVRVLLMTGYVTHAGNFPMLRKPFRALELVERIRLELGQGRWSQ